MTNNLIDKNNLNTWTDGLLTLGILLFIIGIICSSAAFVNGRFTQVGIDLSGSIAFFAVGISFVLIGCCCFFSGVYCAIASMQLSEK